MTRTELKHRKKLADYLKWGTLSDGTFNPHTLNLLDNYINKLKVEAYKKGYIDAGLTSLDEQTDPAIMETGYTGEQEQ